MPNRIIRESCRTSATLYQLSDGAERMFWRLTTVADDFGRFEADPQILRSQCFPLWPEARLKTAKVAHWLEEMVKAELVTLYAAGGKALGFFQTWEKYQHSRAKTSKYPSPTSENICSQMFSHVPVFENRESRIESRYNPSPAEQEPVDPDAWGTPENLVELYNRLTPEDHPKVTKLSDKRRDKARKYLKAFPERSFWIRVFTEIKFSVFLCGGSTASPHFRGDLDWLLTAGRDGTENAVKVAEGKYRDR